jgi:hypothetical protein
MTNSFESTSCSESDRLHTIEESCYGNTVSYPSKLEDADEFSMEAFMPSRESQKVLQEYFQKISSCVGKLSCIPLTQRVEDDLNDLCHEIASAWDNLINVKLFPKTSNRRRDTNINIRGDRRKALMAFGRRLRRIHNDLDRIRCNDEEIECLEVDRVMTCIYVLSNSLKENV